jgi:hypothetical protein
MESPDYYTDIRVEKQPVTDGLNSRIYSVVYLRFMRLLKGYRITPYLCEVKTATLVQDSLS